MLLRFARRNQVDLTTQSGGVLAGEEELSLWLRPPRLLKRPQGARLPAELEQELHKKPQRTCIVKMMSTRNLWKNIVVLCVNS